MLHSLLIAAAGWLAHHHQRVNRMNVFPVPDGDTGTNMLLTMQRAVHELNTFESANIALVAEHAAQGALLGARGNSGTILSMLIRGFAAAIEGHSRMDATLLAQALTAAVDYAYATVRSVMEPVEGTILTVAKDTAQAVSHAVDEAQHTDLAEILAHMVTAARASLENTPNLLPILKQANVVDSGGMGWLMLLEGMQRHLQGAQIPAMAPPAPVVNEAPMPIQDVLAPDDEAGYGYDVQFLMRGESLDLDQIRRDIAALGWSPLVDGDHRLIKVHVHVHDPGVPLSYAIQQGAVLDDIVVENMQRQYQAYMQTAPTNQPSNPPRIAVITVANGDGLAEIFKAYGASIVITGGQTMNPSTDDFLQHIRTLPVDEIILLPNNRNIIMAAEQAAHLSPGKDVRVVPSRTIPQGISALLVYGDWLESGTMDEMVAAMQDQMQTIISAEVTQATRTVDVDGIHAQEGDYIGILDGKIIVSAADVQSIITAVMQSVQARGIELATIYYGQASSLDERQALKARFRAEYAEVEIEMIDGGQPLYPYIISFE